MQAVLMTKIEDYIQLALNERQTHLRLVQECIERGGYSAQFKGLLAHILGTTIPCTKKIQVCHACNNGKCSNPYHLYWGTQKENSKDAVLSGTYVSARSRMIAKYGLEKTKELMKAALAQR